MAAWPWAHASKGNDKRICGSLKPICRERRRTRGERGKQLLRRRGELLERSFAHVYDTGGMRRTHLRGHPNILKRLLLHVAAFNLSLILRREAGVGTLRGLPDLRNRLFFCFRVVWMLLKSLWKVVGDHPTISAGQWATSGAHSGCYPGQTNL